MKKEIVLQSTITCPKCGHQKEENMPLDACQFFYTCENCNENLKPEKGDCCVYCSYGSMPCPPIQTDGRNYKNKTKRNKEMIVIPLMTT